LSSISTSSNDPKHHNPTLMGRIWLRTLGSLDPRTLPLMSRRSYWLEFASIFFFALALACVEGGVISVFARTSFDGVVAAVWLNFAVAFLAAAPDISNILSFYWTQQVHGRPKIGFVNGLQAGLIIAVALLAFVPLNLAGLFLLMALTLAARVCWAGIITIRPTIWRQNYPRQYRAKVVGKIWTAQVVVLAVVGLLVGLLLERHAEVFRYIFPGVAIVATASVFLLSKVRVRREAKLLAVERASAPTTMPPWHGLITVFGVLKRDKLFGRFVMWMFVLGFGNLMLTPVLVITLKEQFGFDYLKPILIASTVPALVMIFFMPLWARFLDRAHVVRFRSIHSWSFVLSQSTFVAAVWLKAEPLLYVGAVFQGIGFAGGALAWNLGHADFAPPDQTSQYMATHVTLTGIRGIIAPLIAVGLYTQLKIWFAGGPGGAATADATQTAATLVLGLSSVLCIVGALGFGQLRRQMGALAEATQRGHA
jgi:hypothetical protein